MKLSKKALSILLILAMLFVWAPQGKTSEAATTIKLRVGAIYTLRPSLTGSVKWSSSKKYVASVSKAGKVTAKDPGTTYIKAKTASKTITYKVKVKAKSGKKGTRYNPKTLPTKTPKGVNFTYYEDNTKIGKFNIQITKFVYGDAAAILAKNNPSNPVPTANQQYLYFEVTLNYKSSYVSRTVNMSNVFNYNKNIFGAYGARHLKPIDWGMGFGSVENMKTVNISPGNIRTAGVAILVEKGFTPITFRLQTGKDSYTWVKL